MNEVLANSDASPADAIELHNTTDQPIDLSGWYLSDSKEQYQKFRIPDATTIAGGGYLVFDEGDFNPDDGSNPEAFALNGEQGDDVWLLAADANDRLTHFVDHVEFGGSRPDTTIGRWPDGSGVLFPLRAQALGADNAPPQLPSVLISELQYNPGSNRDFEFVELSNATGGTVDLAGWRLRGGSMLTSRRARPSLLLDHRRAALQSEKDRPV